MLNFLILVLFIERHWIEFVWELSIVAKQEEKQLRWPMSNETSNISVHTFRTLHSFNINDDNIQSSVSWIRTYIRQMAPATIEMLGNVLDPYQKLSKLWSDIENDLPQQQTCSLQIKQATAILACSSTHNDSSARFLKSHLLKSFWNSFYDTQTTGNLFCPPDC